MIVWLASYPRSGNTLFRIALHYIYGVHTYSASDNDPQFFEYGVADVIGHKRLPQPMAYLLRLHDYTGSEPWFIKTHCNGDEIPRIHRVIHIIRDGRAACVSEVHRMMEWTDKPTGSFPELLWNKVSAKGQWSKYVLSWYGRADVIVKFERLVDNPVDTTIRSIDALNLDWDMSPRKDVSMPTFDELHKMYPLFFRKGKKASWREEMPSRYEEVFWRNHGNAMRIYGYERH